MVTAFTKISLQDSVSIRNPMEFLQNFQRLTTVATTRMLESIAEEQVTYFPY